MATFSLEQFYPQNNSVRGQESLQFYEPSVIARSNPCKSQQAILALGSSPLDSGNPNAKAASNPANDLRLGKPDRVPTFAPSVSKLSDFGPFSTGIQRGYILRFVIGCAILPAAPDDALPFEDQRPHHNTGRWIFPPPHKCMVLRRAVFSAIKSWPPR
jgi:hypothetical protein